MVARTLQDGILGHGPGLICVLAVVGLAYGIQNALASAVPGLGTTAFLLGLALSSTGRLPGIIGPGLRIATRPLLRVAIVLLGLQMTADGLLALGWPVILGLVGVVGATLLLSAGFARLVKADTGLALLIAVGSAICGASAIMAANQVVRRNEGQVAYAIACVTIFGTFSILMIPVLGRYFGLAGDVYAIWVGASVHEVAQVVAAADRGDIDVSAMATAVKLARVVMLPMVIWILVRTEATLGPETISRPQEVPGFVFGYLGCVALASTGVMPPEVLAVSKTLTGLLLAVSLAAIGLQANVRTLDRYGWRPFAVAALAWTIVTAAGLLVAQICAKP